jgi:hypothetical protein
MEWTSALTDETKAVLRSELGPSQASQLIESAAATNARFSVRAIARVWRRLAAEYPELFGDHLTVAPAQVDLTSLIVMYVLERRQTELSEFRGSARERNELGRQWRWLARHAGLACTADLHGFVISPESPLLYTLARVGGWTGMSFADVPELRDLWLVNGHWCKRQRRFNWPGVVTTILHEQIHSTLGLRATPGRGTLSSRFTASVDEACTELLCVLPVLPRHAVRGGWITDREHLYLQYGHQVHALLDVMEADDASGQRTFPAVVELAIRNLTARSDRERCDLLNELSGRRWDALQWTLAFGPVSPELDERW